MFRFFRKKKNKDEARVDEVEQTLESQEEVAEAEAEVLPQEMPQETQESESILPENSSFDNLWPTPDAQGKVHIKVSLSDALPPISDEELERAALAEVREDDLSRFGYGDEPEYEDEEELEPDPEPGMHEEPDPQPEPELQAVLADKKGWFSRLKSGLARSNIGAIFVGSRIDEDLFEELENSLLMADAGGIATEKIINELRQAVKKQRLETADEVKQALCDIIASYLKPLEKLFDIHEDRTNVVMIAGVNGAGKTTSIGKLAYHFQAHGASMLLAAGDTFRAAAREQLQQWGLRNDVQVISQQGGDPASVAFDAVNSGKAKGTTVVMIDTAGRLPTQTHLMEELKKIKRVIGKADPTAPHEVLLVVDGNTGQNALSQIKAFDAAIGLTGLLITKLDGTAKGGVLVALASGVQGVRPIPVYWIGVGEALEDLQPFVAEEFAQALVG
ncbi:signal recognition particle-docking protein FtsY [Taylorella asinigenitalis]|uniref:Signal recognition particle receptor FtsY n=1 Tax=Taylorella asinigenitalis (strain MCE3) TaxID=1008459 RepID=G4QCJ6_TAYAM|nr:signal recognition particle-docking protein FtsY [Taylorella asinigenitalis]AEP36126.1 Signal recognition particle receptor protein FtsY [Taylorella asinigenitalis MCE3]